MAKPRRLKVFQAQFGFHDSVVAASSQTAALRAWGTHQNLFAEGLARVSNDHAAMKAALAHPDVPLKRAIGSSEAFEVAPTDLPKVSRPLKARAGRQTAKARPAPPPEIAADRSALDTAEQSLRALEAARSGEEIELRRRQDDLDAAKAKARRDYAKARQAATAAVCVARRNYRKAGGRN